MPASRLSTILKRLPVILSIAAILAIGIFWVFATLDKYAVTTYASSSEHRRKPDAAASTGKTLAELAGISELPDRRPRDFKLAFHAGAAHVARCDGIDLFQGVVRKDIGEGGMAQVGYSPTDEALDRLYALLRDADILSYPALCEAALLDGGQAAGAEAQSGDAALPQSYSLRFAIGKTEYVMHCDDLSAATGPEGVRLKACFDGILSLVKSTDAYAKLPERTEAKDVALE